MHVVTPPHTLAGASNSQGRGRASALPRHLTEKQVRDITIGIFAGAFESTSRQPGGVGAEPPQGQGGAFDAERLQLHQHALICAEQLLACLADFGLQVTYAPTQVPIDSVEAQLVLIEALADLRHAIKRQAAPAEVEAARQAHHAALTDYLGATRREFCA